LVLTPNAAAGGDWLIVAVALVDCPVPLTAVNVTVHCRAAVVEAIVAGYAPLQATGAGLLPVQRDGADSSEHEEALLLEKRNTTWPPVAGTALGIGTSAAVGVVEGAGTVVVVVAVGAVVEGDPSPDAAAPWITVT
jgi:hypothetical protein